MKIAIVGAGLSGLASAKMLSQAGHDVRLFDKGRNVGGRCATRRTDFGSIDHGLQLLDGADERLRESLQSITLEGVEVPLCPSQPVAGSGPFWRPPEGVNAFAKHLAQGLDITAQTAVIEIRKSADEWTLESAEGALWQADIAVLALPPEQADAFGITPPDLPLNTAQYRIQVGALIASAAALDLPPTGPLDMAGLSWISLSADSRRASVFADDDRSAELIDTDRNEIAAWIWERLTNGAEQPDYLRGHRWRFSRVSRPLGTKSYYNAGLNLGYCGDWFIGPNAGDAIESGEHLAKAILTAQG